MLLWFGCYIECRYAECQFGECVILIVDMLSGIMLSAFILGAFMPSAMGSYIIGYKENNQKFVLHFISFSIIS